MLQKKKKEREKKSSQAIDDDCADWRYNTIWNHMLLNLSNRIYKYTHIFFSNINTHTWKLYISQKLGIKISTNTWCRRIMIWGQKISNWQEQKERLMFYVFCVASIWMKENLDIGYTEVQFITGGNIGFLFF